MFCENSSVLQSGYRCNSTDERNFSRDRAFTAPVGYAPFVNLRKPTILQSFRPKKQTVQTEEQSPNNDSVINLLEDSQTQKLPKDDSKTMIRTSKSILKRPIVDTQSLAETEKPNPIDESVTVISLLEDDQNIPNKDLVTVINLEDETPANKPKGSNQINSISFESLTCLACLEPKPGRLHYHFKRLQYKMNPLKANLVLNDVLEKSDGKSTDTHSYKNTDEKWEKAFYEKLDTYFKRFNKPKKRPQGIPKHTNVQWTMEKINSMIKFLETLQQLPPTAPPCEKEVMLNDPSYKEAKYYDIFYEGDQKSLIFYGNSNNHSGRIVPYEDYFNVLLHIHLALEHGNTADMCEVLKKDNYFIPLAVVKMFVKLCYKCFTKVDGPECDPFHYFYTNRVESKIRSQNGIFSNRGRFEVIFMQVPSEKYRFILYYQDFKTKLTILRPLKTNDADEIALELLKIFFEVGCPFILDSLYSHRLIEPVIVSLYRHRPGFKLLIGSIENEDGKPNMEHVHIKKMLLKCMLDNDITSWQSWSIGIYFLQFQLNSDQQILNKAPFVIRINRTSELNYIHHLKTEKDLMKWLALPRIHKDKNDLDELIVYSTPLQRSKKTYLAQRSKKNAFTLMYDTTCSKKYNHSTKRNTTVTHKSIAGTSEKNVTNIDKDTDIISIKDESEDEYLDPSTHDIENEYQEPSDPYHTEDEYLEPPIQRIDRESQERPDPYHTELATENATEIEDKIKTETEITELENNEHIAFEQIKIEELHEPLNLFNEKSTPDAISKTGNIIIIEDEVETETKDSEKNKNINLNDIKSECHEPLNLFNDELAPDNMRKNIIIIDDEIDTETIKKDPVEECEYNIEPEKTRKADNQIKVNNQSQSETKSIGNVDNKKREYEVEVLMHVEDVGLQPKRFKVLL